MNAELDGLIDRYLVTIPLQERMETSVDIRCSTVPLTVTNESNGS